MPIISANTLFHFTSRKENLLSILETGFMPSYSPEFGPVINNRIRYCEIPMVCFCDLPISNLSKHIGLDGGKKGYGKYGLGMTKEWGIRKKLNPVTYATEVSHYVEDALEANNTLLRMKRHLDHRKNLFFQKFRDGKIPADYDLSEDEKGMFGMSLDTEKALQFNMALLNYVKPYENAIDKRRYYNEREWRSVVPYNEKTNYEVPVIMPEIFPDQMARKEEFKAAIVRNHMLLFDPEDIKYIIVESDTDINEVIEKMNSLSDNYSEIERARLIGRIITCEQIEEDF